MPGRRCAAMRILCVALVLVVGAGPVPAVAEGARRPGYVRGPQPAEVPRLGATLWADIPGTQLSLGESDSARLDPATGFTRGVINVYLRKGQSAAAVLEADPGTDFDMYLFPPGTASATDSASAIEVSDTPGSSDEWLWITARVEGEYYFAVVAAPGSPAGYFTVTTIATQEDPDHDIYGVEPPSPTVSGDLNPWWDVDDVYMFYAVAGTTIRATLAGAPGTDFDLLLYNSDAKSIWGDIDPVTFSSGPTSAEAINYIVPADGLYFLDVYCPWASDPGAYVLNASVIPLATSITINQSAYAVRLPKPFILSGVVNPGRMLDECVVYVKKPGSSRWSYSSLRLAYALTGDGGAKWWYRYTPRLRGTYQFDVRYAAVPGRAAARSRVVKVVVR